MKSAVKVSEAIARLRKHGDTAELEEAIDDFLAAYGELRSQFYYEDQEAQANAKAASTLLEAIDRAPIVHFEDGTFIRCRRGSGVQIVRMPLEEEQNDN